MCDTVSNMDNKQRIEYVVSVETILDFKWEFFNQRYMLNVCFIFLWTYVFHHTVFDVQ